MPLPEYYLCRDCNEVNISKEWLSVDGIVKCPVCKHLDWKEPWPDISIRKILEFVLNSSPLEAHYDRFASLLLSACLEDLMRDQLRLMALGYDTGDHVGLLLDPLLDGYRGRQRQLLLYRRIGYGSFADNCKEAGHPAFLEQWKRISEVRNHFAHSAKPAESKLGFPAVHPFISETLKVFHFVHNKYNKETVSYDAAMTSPAERKREWQEMIAHLQEDEEELEE